MAKEVWTVQFEVEVSELCAVEGHPRSGGEPWFVVHINQDGRWDATANGLYFYAGAAGDEPWIKWKLVSRALADARAGPGQEIESVMRMTSRGLTVIVYRSEDEVLDIYDHSELVQKVNLIIDRDMLPGHVAKALAGMSRVTRVEVYKGYPGDGVVVYNPMVG